MLLDREQPLSLRYLPMQPEGPIQPLQVVRVTFLARIYKNSCEGSFVRRITDSSGFTSDTKPMKMSTFDALAGNSHGKFSKEITLPAMAPGPATYQIFTTEWCNPLQHLIWPMYHSEDIVNFIIAGPYPPPSPPIEKPETVVSEPAPKLSDTGTKSEGPPTPTLQE